MRYIRSAPVGGIRKGDYRSPPDNKSLSLDVMPNNYAAESSTAALDLL